ncbi:hypothetical protein K438DRAFT_1751978 [Mycena galopus ATCC 62051]|nr:hypothetical protein K438DRAFT_1751978 [Mycena galopus ATCC 62051]
MVEEKIIRSRTLRNKNIEVISAKCGVWLATEARRAYRRGWAIYNLATNNLLDVRPDQGLNIESGAITVFVSFEERDPEAEVGDASEALLEVVVLAVEVPVTEDGESSRDVGLELFVLNRQAQRSGCNIRTEDPRQYYSVYIEVYKCLPKAVKIVRRGVPRNRTRMRDHGFAVVLPKHLPVFKVEEKAG